MKQCAGIFLLTILIVFSLPVGAETQYVSHQDFAALPQPPCDATLSYGADSLQFGDLRVPDGPGPHPVAIVIHGGCWLSMADLHVMDHFCDALTKTGIATWNLEYRRVDSPGGGWPGTFTDVGLGVDHIRSLAKEYNLDLDRVVITGHSSGGHLALWAGARHLVPEDSQLYSESSFVPAGVVSLAGPADLRGMVERSIAVCGSDVISTLLGGSQEEVPAHYRNASPIMLLPNSVGQIVIHGSDDPAIPPELGRAYVEAAKAHGENIGFFVIPGAAHFEMIAPWTSSWPIVEAAIQSLLFVPKEEGQEVPQ